jgi:hypothetical protein
MVGKRSFRYASMPSYLRAMTIAPIRAATSLPAGTFALEIEVPSSVTVWPAVSIAIEGACMHVYLASTSLPAIAWPVTGLNALALLWLWRAQRATRRARLVVSDAFIEVRAWSGFRCRFPRSIVERAEVATWDSLPVAVPDFLDISGGEPNVILVLRQPTEVRVTLGIHKAVSQIGLRLSDAAGLLALLR